MMLPEIREGMVPGDVDRAKSCRCKGGALGLTDGAGYLSVVEMEVARGHRTGSLRAPSPTSTYGFRGVREAG